MQQSRPECSLILTRYNSHEPAMSHPVDDIHRFQEKLRVSPTNQSIVDYHL